MVCRLAIFTIPVVNICAMFLLSWIITMVQMVRAGTEKPKQKQIKNNQIDVERWKIQMPLFEHCMQRQQQFHY